MARRRAGPPAAALAAALALAGCAAPPFCAPPAARATQFDVYLGRDIAGRGEVTDAEWAAFLDSEATPRFGDGLTVADLRGQWRDAATGAIARERSKRLTVVAPDAARARDAVRAVAEAYKRRFAQQSALVVEQPVCAAF
ncbi:MAG: DUF3574 domain-containing protein [Rhodospirillales bacterium]|nr:MAG: DUF3574 domain-containing protein [Rhodospirillales bacterium]